MGGKWHQDCLGKSGWTTIRACHSSSFPRHHLVALCSPYVSRLGKRTVPHIVENQKSQALSHNHHWCRLFEMRTQPAGHFWRRKQELVSETLLWSPRHGRTSIGRAMPDYIYPLRYDSGCLLHFQPLPCPLSPIGVRDGGSGGGQLTPQFGQIWHLFGQKTKHLFVTIRAKLGLTPPQMDVSPYADALTACIDLLLTTSPLLVAVSFPIIFPPYMSSWTTNIILMCCSRRRQFKPRRHNTVRAGSAANYCRRVCLVLHP